MIPESGFQRPPLAASERTSLESSKFFSVPLLLGESHHPNFFLLLLLVFTNSNTNFVHFSFLFLVRILLLHHIIIIIILSCILDSLDSRSFSVPILFDYNNVVEHNGWQHWISEWINDFGLWATDFFCGILWVELVGCSILWTQSSVNSHRRLGNVYIVFGQKHRTEKERKWSPILRLLDRSPLRCHFCLFAPSYRRLLLLFSGYNN